MNNKTKISLADIVSSQEGQNKTKQLILSREKDQIEVTIKLTRKVDSIGLEVVFITIIPLICDRCAIDFKNEIKVTGHREILLEDKAATNDELALPYPHDGQLDILPIVNEEIIINLSGQHLCTENCLGLCQTCGADLNKQTNHKC
ncbi:MAG: DUF177 domain-containing protein [bacterium]